MPNYVYMKGPILIFIITLMYSCSASVVRNNATIRFTDVKHDFGKITLKKEVIYSFEFLNTGKTPLVIQDVKTSCGCTVPEWTKVPVKGGKTSKITVKYDAAFPGTFHKSIEVFYNGEGSPAKLEIEGEVGGN